MSNIPYRRIQPKQNRGRGKSASGRTVQTYSKNRRDLEAQRRVDQVRKTGSHRLLLHGLSLRQLPDLSNLPNVELLDISNNQLTKLPDSIADLSSLRQLDASDNLLTGLPKAFLRFDQLEALYLHSNEELRIPPELMGARFQIGASRTMEGRADPKDIINHLLQQKLVRLNEAKLLLVGQGAVGKTSLVKALIHSELCDPQEAKTEGINIEQWEVPGKVADEKVKVNIWDFGGQEIMHATHQFFLTKRSLYLVVIDARKGEQESNLNYWLKIIKSYCGDSPIIIVINKHEPPNILDLNERRIALDFSPNIIGFCKVSCMTGAGIEDLRNAVVEGIHQLSHVFDELPEAYIESKRALEDYAKKRDFLDISEYQGICESQNVKSKRDQDRLLRFLHDLGTVLNFDDPDDPYEMKDTNVLNPEWVTSGVYEILNSNRLMHAGGVLETVSLGEILTNQDRYPPERHRFITEIMRKFELCFEFPDSNGKKLLIPELLTRNEPDLNWTSEQALNFRIDFDVLPSGLICRFIVRLHHSLTDKPTYWRSGVVLEISECKCLVRSDSNIGIIFVSIVGPINQRRSALAVVRDHMNSIVDTIPGITAAEKIPLSRDPSVVVDYKHVRRLENAGETRFLPEGAQDEYEVDELLNGIDDTSRRANISTRKLARARAERALDVAKETLSNDEIRRILGEGLVSQEHARELSVDTAEIKNAATPNDDEVENTSLLNDWRISSALVASIFAGLVVTFTQVTMYWQLGIVVFAIGFFYLISKNPVARYMRLATTIIGLWLGANIVPLFQLKYEGTNLAIEYLNEGPGLGSHIITAVLVALLLILDFLERKKR